jgi:hypothetical protein
MRSETTDVSGLLAWRAMPATLSRQIPDRPNRRVTMHEYLFDVKLFAAVRVKANSEEEARRLIATNIDASSANLGAWPNGDPILAEVSLDDGPEDLIEIDGEPVE